MGSRIELIRFFTSLDKINFAEIQHISLQDWLYKKIHHKDVFDLLQTLCRIVTYANDPDIQSAGATLSQLQMALSGGGVIYLNVGWQTLVDGLVSAAQKANVRIVTGKRVVEVRQVIDSSILTLSSWRIRLSDGSIISASTLIITGNPRDVYEFFRYDKPSFLSTIGDLVGKPVRAACLDVALSSLPNPGVPVALGVDSPFYLSVHSVSAKLAPKGGALIHVMKYLGSSHEPNPRDDRLQMEAFLDMVHLAGEM